MSHIEFDDEELVEEGIEFREGEQVFGTENRVRVLEQSPECNNQNTCQEAKCWASMPRSGEARSCPICTGKFQRSVFYCEY